MGKSPGKWIKSVFLGRKYNRSQTSKDREDLKTGKNKENSNGKGPHLDTSTTVISHPVLINSSNSDVLQAQTRTHTNLVTEAITLSKSQQAENAGPCVPIDLENDEVKQAATKVQAFLRGYQSRRTFHVLKGIIRLQAVVRGHLVRRQAVVTLHCLYGIVKLQTVVHRRKVRLSSSGLEVKTQCDLAKDIDFKQLDNWKAKLSSNSFIYKLLALLPVAKPLWIHYAHGEPNSVFCWLERWTLSHFWRPLAQPNTVVSSKTQSRKGALSVASKSNRQKKVANRNSVTTSASANSIVEHRLKSNHRRTQNSAVNSEQEKLYNNVEKARQNMRKASASMDTSAKPEPACNLGNVTSSINLLELTTKVSSEKSKDVGITDIAGTLETNALPAFQNESNNALPVESVTHTSESTGEGENTSGMGESISKDQHISDESQSNTNRRASLPSSSSQYVTTSLQNPSRLPSYMQATESAKAKLRGQVSPGLGSDSIDKSNMTRRHSLPSFLNTSMNGKVSSQSPRLQKLIQATARGGIRNNRSLSSSRDGSEKSIHIAWRR